MNIRFTPLLALSALALSLSACGHMSQRDENTAAGAVIGGVLGHQVGGGAGKDLATVGGAVAGGAIGAQTGRNNDPLPAQSRDVQRCREVTSQTPEFWDVSYNFRGQDHRAQLRAPPGRSVTVNDRGEPRE